MISPETDFLSAAYEIQNMQNRIYMHSNYDPAFIVDEMRKRYHTPEHTSYESCYLTYQPMPVKVENEMLGTIRQHAKWFANGAATKKMYLDRIPYRRWRYELLLSLPDCSSGGT